MISLPDYQNQQTGMLIAFISPMSSLIIIVTCCCCCSLPLCVCDNKRGSTEVCTRNITAGREGSFFAGSNTNMETGRFIIKINSAPYHQQQPQRQQQDLISLKLVFLSASSQALPAVLGKKNLSISQFRVSLLQLLRNEYIPDVQGSIATNGTIRKTLVSSLVIN